MKIIIGKEPTEDDNLGWLDVLKEAMMKDVVVTEDERYIYHDGVVAEIKMTPEMQNHLMKFDEFKTLKDNFENQKGTINK
jgi:hypothetical protein